MDHWDIIPGIRGTLERLLAKMSSPAGPSSKMVNLAEMGAGGLTNGAFLKKNMGDRPVENRRLGNLHIIYIIYAVYTYVSYEWWSIFLMLLEYIEFIGDD